MVADLEKILAADRQGQRKVAQAQQEGLALQSQVQLQAELSRRL